MKEVRTEIEIGASPKKVWAVFTDFRSYPSWNPFIRKAEGTLAPGERIAITLRLGRRMVNLRPTLTVVDEPREVRWLARQFLPRLFDVERRFVLEPLGQSRCRFIQSETGSGVFAPLLMPLLRRQILDGYRRLDMALKERVERAG
ncbi:SRPBCC domain-containing protein [Micromonospora sp. CPCC 205371]|nr:SRPBCC domain-containing protein [Micromonospora sp. CPCC 205371]